jgi:site-specific DNA recombinase
LAEQSRSFLEFCSGNGYEAAAAFLDVPGTEDDLPGFRQLVDFVRQQGARGFLLVVVPSLTSLGETLTEAARHYYEVISLGVPVISVDTQEDIDRVMLDLWSRQRSDERLGDRVKEAMRRKAVKGEALGRPPYGYRVGPKRRLVIVPEEGSVVRYIFRLYLKDGLGIRRIARRLNEEELRTRRGGLWSMVTARDILRNRAYLGTYSRFGVRVPASHAPLISQEDFRRVQERLDQRRPATGPRRVVPFLLSGLAYCGYCRNKMIGVTRKQKWQRRGDGSVRTAQYRYYQCESRTNRSLCDYHTHRADDLEAEVRSAILGGDFGVGSPAGRDGHDIVAEAEAQIRRLRDKARRLDKRLAQYMDAASSGRITIDRLRFLAPTIATQQLEVEAGIVESRRLIRQQATEAERVHQRERLVVRLRDDWDKLSVTERKELLREVLDRVIVHDDRIEVLLRV